MKNKLQILLLLCFFSGLHSQTSYKLATELTDGTKFYINEVGNYNAWVKTIEKTKSTKSKNGKLIRTGGNTLVEFWKCDCGEKKYSSDSRTLYDKNGNVKNSLSDVYEERALPETVGEKILNIICGFDEYLDDITQDKLPNEFSQIQRELDEGVSRYNNYYEGYKIGYKEGYCSPYSGCYHNFPGMPSEALYADNPAGDYDQGYKDGFIKGKADKIKQ